MGLCVMGAGNYVVYYWVSTQRQGRSGLGLEAQKEAVEQQLNGGASLRRSPKLSPASSLRPSIFRKQIGSQFISQPQSLNMERA